MLLNINSNFAKLQSSSYTFALIRINDARIYSVLILWWWYSSCIYCLVPAFCFMLMQCEVILELLTAVLVENASGLVLHLQRISMHVNEIAQSSYLCLAAWLTLALTLKLLQPLKTKYIVHTFFYKNIVYKNTEAQIC